jgi:hypothetical protein
MPRGDRVVPDVAEVSHRGREADRLRDGLRAGLEALRRRQVLGRIEGHGRDHRASGQERRQGFENLGPAIERADAVRGEDLVAREHGQVDAERGEVEHEVRSRLARVEHRERVHRTGHADERIDRVDDPQHVRHVREGDDPRARSDDSGGGIEVEPTIVQNGNVSQHRARPGGELLPRNEIGVVL